MNNKEINDHILKLELDNELLKEVNEKLYNDIEKLTTVKHNLTTHVEGKEKEIRDLKKENKKLYNKNSLFKSDIYNLKEENKQYGTIIDFLKETMDILNERFKFLKIKGYNVKI